MVCDGGGGDALRIQKGQQWKNVKSGNIVTIKDSGCGKYKDDCLCICAPKDCLCHTISPCLYSEPKGERCYYAWALANGEAGLGIVVFDGGKKMRTECFCTCDTYELVR